MSIFDRHRDKIAFAGPDDCWLWSAGVNADGYGSVRAGGAMRRAHRLAYEAVHGEGSAVGLVVRHRCDVPACVNPAHLEIGTPADNVRDRDERGRRIAPKGEANGRSRLVEADVVAIRSLYVRGCRDLGQPGLARRFGVSQPVIGEIVRRESWGHVA